MPTVPQDPEVPALAMLLGPDNIDLLGVLTASSGGAISSVRVGQVRYVPAKSVTVQYEIDVQLGGTATRSTVVVASGLAIPDGVVRLESSGVEVAAWTYPYDPFLPGLPAAADAEQTAALLSELGADTQTVQLRRRAYRAGRRAVVEVIGDSASIYLKVVRPARVALLQEGHKKIAAHVPVPRSLGWSATLGIVALQALHGLPLRKAIEAGHRPLPHPLAIVELLDRIPTTDRPAGPGPLARTGDHVGLLGAILPELSPRLERLATAVSAAPPEEAVAVHGDLHSSQILTDGETVTGLVDVDTAGMGCRSDDLAGLLAQLSTLALTSPQRSHLDAYGASLITQFDPLVDPSGLRLRVAAAVLGFATGPFRVQLPQWPQDTEARIALAERWVESAYAAF